MVYIEKVKKSVKDIKRGDLIIFGGTLFRVYTNAIHPDHAKLNNLTLIDNALRPASTLDLIDVEIYRDSELEVMRLKENQ